LAANNPAPQAEDAPAKEFFKEGELTKNIVDQPVTSGVVVPGEAAPPPPPPKVVEEENPQIIMDCYILQITEDARTTKGNNIMDNLAVTLNPGSYFKFAGSMWGSGAVPKDPTSNGDTQTLRPDSAYFNVIPPATNPSPAPTLGEATTTLNNAGSISGRIFAAGISWAGLTYSLNIANAGDQRVEIISRPTLTTFLKKESQFFSGTELVNVAAGQYGSNLNRLPIGVGVAVTPKALVGDMVTLNIGIESSILRSGNPNLLTTVDMSKTRVETTVKLRLGETIMLGGIYERSEQDSNNGFPGLRDIPFLQYFFSQETTVSSRHSVAILLTPRSPDIIKSAVNRAMTREAVRPHYSELVSRNPDWFNPEINAVNIFSYFSEDPILYYEFRTGDILPPSWGYDITLSDKLGELKSFLYY
jgi:general secretion pathway protein D